MLVVAPFDEGRSTTGDEISSFTSRSSTSARAVGVSEGETETGKLRYGGRRAMHEEEC